MGASKESIGKLEKKISRKNAKLLREINFLLKNFADQSDQFIAYLQRGQYPTFLNIDM